jgi:small subunit ribosomal protein S21
VLSALTELFGAAQPVSLVIAMARTIINPDIPFETALKQFQRKVQQAGILAEARRRRHYETPQARRKRKAAAQLRKRKRTRF